MTPLKAGIVIMRVQLPAPASADTEHMTKCVLWRIPGDRCGEGSLERHCRLVRVEPLHGYVGGHSAAVSMGGGGVSCLRQGQD